MYTEQQLAAIAKRENNTKRNYLVVNPLQGKHLPVSPGKALCMFRELALILKEKYRGDRILIIGFAETATAIGAALAAELDCDYMQTTREEITGVSYLYFTESHSHAMEQKVVREDLERALLQTDRIIFAEDEVTTGNTILNIVQIIRKEFGNRVVFSVASILNGMNQQAEEIYRNEEIPCHFLVKTNHDSYGEIADRYQGDGIYHPVNLHYDGTVQEWTIQKGYANARRLVSAKYYQQACECLWQEIRQQCDFRQVQDILVLGTEEFMYPALYVADKLEQEGKSVKFHATTRSPIAVSTEAAYPLHERFELRSFYDRDRITYVYELRAYDSVLVITDAGEQEEGERTLLAALQEAGNKNVTVIRWWER